MSSDKPARPVPIGVKIGFFFLALGLSAWLWLGDWRWAVSGVLTLLVGTVAGAPSKPEPKPERDLR